MKRYYMKNEMFFDRKTDNYIGYLANNEQTDEAYLFQQISCVWESQDLYDPCLFRDFVSSCRYICDYLIKHKGLPALVFSNYNLSKINRIVTFAECLKCCNGGSQYVFDL